MVKLTTTLFLMNELGAKINKNWITVGSYIVLLTFLFFFLGYNEIIFSGPHGIHFMRQTDSLSFASQYYNNGYDFFNPQLFNLKNIDGRAASEFPILYYLTAIFYSIVGKKIFLLKLVHLLVVYVGVFYVFKLSLLILKDYFYSILITLSLFTSTVFSFYSLNYLPDSAALGFVFIGWYFIFRYQIDSKKRSLIISFLFFTLGSLLKVTYLINPLTILFFSIYAVVFNKKGFVDKNESKQIIKYGIVGVAIVALWTVYMIYYNTVYESKSFITGALPIWNLTNIQIHEVWSLITNFWYGAYFYSSSFHFLFLILIFQIIAIYKSSFKLTFTVFVLFLGSIAYFFLFYSQFRDHDYYFLVFFPFIILALINGINTLKNTSNKAVIHIALKLILAVIIIAGMNYSRKKLYERNNASMDDYSRTGLLIEKNLGEIEKLKIEDNAKFIIAPDLCSNGGLFFINRMGWTINTTEEITIDSINSFQNLGADYLLLATTEENALTIGNTTGNLVFKGKGISIFKLNHTTDKE